MQPIKISKIRAYRHALGKTQKEMSELLNIHHVVYGRKERMLAAFTDKEKVTLLNYFKEYFPNETIDSLFFRYNVQKSTKTFQVSNDQIRLLKRFKDKYLIKNTFLHYTIRKELKVWKIKNYTSIHYVLQWYLYHL